MKGKNVTKKAIIAAFTVPDDDTTHVTTSTSAATETEGAILGIAAHVLANYDQGEINI